MLSDSAKLKGYAMRLQSIIETAIDGIITIDDEGLIESVNPAAASQFQYLPKEIIGKNIKYLMPQPYRREHDQYLERYNKTREPRIIGIGREVIGLKKDGTTFPFNLAVSEVILHDRVVFTGIIHDLTDLKQAQNNLLELNESLEKKIAERTEELEEAVNGLLTANNKLRSNELLLSNALEKEKELNELKSRFVSMASHEFRTPLSTILSSAALISRYQSSDQNEQRIKHVERIKSAVQNLTGILNDFLSLSKIEEGKEDINLSNIIVKDVCETVIQDVSGLLKEGQKVNYIPNEISVFTDERILKNILFNLTSNAIKYSKPKGIITINVQQESNKITISVTDNGIGIPLEDQKHLFSRFFRASNVINIQGTGLGLNIVKRYLDLLDGSITFQSAEGIGTKFIVELKKEQ